MTSSVTVFEAAIWAR